jgi:hypothetical protein
MYARLLRAGQTAAIDRPRTSASSGPTPWSDATARCGTWPAIASPDARPPIGELLAALD